MMKTKIITLLSLISVFHFLTGQRLIFKDKNLQKAVTENFDLNKDGSINQFEADRIENLFLAGKGIISAEDLHYFKNAKMIVMDDNNIANMSLKNMDHLQLFSCTGCKIISFKAENLKKITSLYLDNNKIENISLKSIPLINQLTVSLNKIKAIDLSSLKSLKNLNLEHNQIQKLDISQNPNLQTLNIKENPLKETDIRKGNQDLTIFGFHYY
ncbi:leucine-rich repeat domain-containing protein [Chryseobacterium taeanense]|uniref:leucine-rich repeat domain-containing protein n=1 Tax=Chryseobacterium taeanense TaxID=311334 RepID=UPI0035B0371D